MGPFVIANLQFAKLSPPQDACIQPGEIHGSVFTTEQSLFQDPNRTGV